MYERERGSLCVLYYHQYNAIAHSNERKGRKNTPMSQRLYERETVFTIPREQSRAAALSLRLHIQEFPNLFPLQELLQAGSLLEAFALQDRWRLSTDSEENIADISLVGGEQSNYYRDEDYRMFCALAPFVDTSQGECYIELENSEGARWQYYFRNGKCYNRPGRIIYDDLPVFAMREEKE